MKKEEKKCEHLFETKTRKYQERCRKYITDGKYDIATLDQEVLVIFCRKCGEFKEIKNN